MNDELAKMQISWLDKWFREFDCLMCKGTGRLELTYTAATIPLRTDTTCPYCKGTGRIERKWQTASQQQPDGE